MTKPGATFHDGLDIRDMTAGVVHDHRQFEYHFENFHHPLVGELISKLNTASLAQMLDADWHATLKASLFDAQYEPTRTGSTDVTGAPVEIDLLPDGAYANYNWELFFHIPLTIAVHLSKTQRFAEAQRWFHYIFDPTASDVQLVPDGENASLAPELRVWKFLAFREPQGASGINEMIALLNKPEADLRDDERLARERILAGYEAILAKPFKPHAVARTRVVAYQYAVVMKYLDNLIAWGDQLFQQDTIESINEATQRYVTAANLLGPRPQRIPPRGTVRPRTFAQLRATMDPMGNALVDLESQFPFNLAPAPTGGGSDGAATGPLFGIGRTLYFCIPRNEKLLGYWDTVGDRLFKIRHCMNIAGVVRSLALFELPIDPGLLVKAAAAGLDVSSVVNGSSEPVSPVRAMTLVQKALELTAEVRGLGGALLAAIEKGDSEHMASLRQRHEVAIGAMSQEVRFLQWKAAEEATKSLQTSRAAAIGRLRYYQRLLGLPDDPNAPESMVVGSAPLTEETFDDAYANLVERYDRKLTLQALPTLRIVPPAPDKEAGEQGPMHLTTNEDRDLNVHSPAARIAREDAMVADLATSALALLPDIGIDIHYWGLGGNSRISGSTIISNAGHFKSSWHSGDSARHESRASSASKTASFERRTDEWIFQYNSAAHELMQLGRQTLSSLIAEQIARHEYESTKRLHENAQEVHQVLRDKFSNEELYLWMQGELSRLYYEYFRFAFDTAKKAERAVRHELMRPETDAQEFVKFTYWEGGRKGLLAGEALYLDLKRMEVAYLESNRREFELTRHVSIRQLDPVALLALRETGSCEIAIPEWLYDRDCPGHYMRRIKSVALSIPSVVGPYTSVNCTLSLLKSSVRRSALVGEGYERRADGDDRFIDYTGAVQSVVTSSGVNDSGLFEANLRDERYLPFENAGAVSTWKLALPADYRAFDYTTISDVVLHVRYKARQGVPDKPVSDSVGRMMAVADATKLALSFDLRRDFATEWAVFESGSSEFSFEIRRDHFPYFTSGKRIQVNGLYVIQQDATSVQVPMTPLPLLTENESAFRVNIAAMMLRASAATMRAGESVFVLVQYSLLNEQ